jgi:hypothetical protein
LSVDRNKVVVYLTREQIDVLVGAAAVAKHHWVEYTPRDVATLGRAVGALERAARK